MEELEQLKTKVAELETALTAEKQGRADDKANHEKAIAEKDAIIQQKTEDIVGARKQYKHLSEMTEEEKSKLTKREIEVREQLEAHEADVAKFRKEQADALKKEVDARKERILTKLAGTNKELREKIEKNFTRIIDHDKAQTEEEIAGIAQSAFNMLGEPRANPLNQAINGGGDGMAGGQEGNSYADTEAGKSLSQAMGLPQPPAGQNQS
jgi:hypothetical protein